MSNRKLRELQAKLEDDARFGPEIRAFREACRCSLCDEKKVVPEPIVRSGKTEWWHFEADKAFECGRIHGDLGWGARRLQRVLDRLQDALVRCDSFESFRSKVREVISDLDAFLHHSHGLRGGQQ